MTRADELRALPGKAISIRQPWCHFILNEGKIIENRSWPTGYRGPVLLHAAKVMTRYDWEDGADLLDAIKRQDRDANLLRRARIREDLRHGGIVGVVDIVDCVTDHPSPWFGGRYGFVLANPRALPFVPCKGALGFFNVPEEVLSQMRSALLSALISQEAEQPAPTQQTGEGQSSRARAAGIPVEGESK